MAANYPSFNDTKQVLLYKGADNLYQALVASGSSGLTPPRADEPIASLEKKIAFYTAVAAE